jgi:hypothetical protein
LNWHSEGIGRRAAAASGGFAGCCGEEDDWFEYRLLSDPRFLKRIEAARKSARAGKVTRLEDLDW